MTGLWLVHAQIWHVSRDICLSMSIGDVYTVECMTSHLPHNNLLLVTLPISAGILHPQAFWQNLAQQSNTIVCHTCPEILIVLNYCSMRLQQELGPSPANTEYSVLSVQAFHPLQADQGVLVCRSA